MPDSFDRADGHQRDLPWAQMYTLRLRDARILPRVGGIAGTVGRVSQAGPPPAVNGSEPPPAPSAEAGPPPIGGKSRAGRRARNAFARGVGRTIGSRLIASQSDYLEGPGGSVLRAPFPR